MTPGSNIKMLFIVIAFAFFIIESAASSFQASYLAVALCGMPYLDDSLVKGLSGNNDAIDKFKSICNIVNAHKRNPERDLSFDYIFFQSFDNWFENFCHEKGLNPTTPRELFQYLLSALFEEDVKEYFDCEKTTHLNTPIPKVYPSTEGYAKRFRIAKPSEYFATYGPLSINENGQCSISLETKMTDPVGTEHRYMLDLIVVETKHEQFAIYPAHNHDGLLQWKITSTSEFVNGSAYYSTRILSDDEFWKEFHQHKVLSLYRYNKDKISLLLRRPNQVRAQGSVPFSTIMSFVVLIAILEILRPITPIIISKDTGLVLCMLILIYMNFHLLRNLTRLLE